MNEAQALTLEAGKEYIGEDGRKYHVGFKLKYWKNEHVWAGEDDEGCVCFWREDGTSNSDPTLLRVADVLEGHSLNGEAA